MSTHEVTSLRLELLCFTLNSFCRLVDAFTQSSVDAGSKRAQELLQVRVETSLSDNSSISFEKSSKKISCQ